MLGCYKDAPPVEQKESFIKFYGDAYINKAKDIIHVGGKYYLLINRQDDDKSWFRVQCVDEYGNTIGESLEQGGDGIHNYWANSMISLNNGNIAIVGSCQNNEGKSYSDIYVKIIDQNLNEISDTIYSKLENIERGYFIEENTTDGFLLSGIREFISSVTIQRFTLVLDNNFNIIDTTTATIYSNDIGSTVPIDNAGILIAGGGLSSGSYMANIVEQTMLGKDANVFLSGVNGFFSSIKIINYPEILVCGANYNGSLGRYDAYVSLLRFGEIEAVWGKDFGGKFNDNASSITLTSNGNILVAGSKAGDDGKTDIYVFKLDMDGSLLDEKLIGGTDNEYSVKILANNEDDSFMVFGDSFVGENSYSMLVKSSFD